MRNTPNALNFTGFLANDVGKLGSSPTQVDKQAADKKKAAVLAHLPALRNGLFDLEELLFPTITGNKDLQRAGRSFGGLLQARSVAGGCYVPVQPMSTGAPRSGQRFRESVETSCPQV